MLDKNGTIIDAFVMIYYVPPQEINAKLSVDIDLYKTTDTIKLQLKNWGPTRVYHGSSYYFQIQGNGRKLCLI